MKIGIHIILSVFMFSGGCITVGAQKTYTLQEALKTAKHNNPYLKTEFYNIQVAEAEVLSAREMYNPTLEFNHVNVAGKKYAEPNSNLYSGLNSESEYRLGKPFRIAGQRKYQIATANKNVSFEQFNFADIERNLYLEVASKWLEVSTIQNHLKIIETAQRNIDSLIITNNVRFKNQVITQTDMYRTELLEKQYALLYRTAYQELKNTQKELQYLIGVPDSVQIDTTANFILTSTSTDLASLLEEALNKRSDVLSARTYIDLTESNLKLQKSLALPQPEVGLIYNPQNTIPYFGVYAVIDLPLFSRNQGEIKRSSFIRDQAEQNLSATRSLLETEIFTAHRSYAVQQENLERFSEMLEQSQTILNNVKYTYLKGGTGIVDFLEAQRSWLETQEQYYEALEQYRKSYIQLLYATGLINQLAQ